MLRILWQELTSGLHDTQQLTHVLIRLIAATLLGGIVGVQRESTRKPAGLRTHVLVSVTTAAFIIASSASGMSSGWNLSCWGRVSRVFTNLLDKESCQA